MTDPQVQVHPSDPGLLRVRVHDDERHIVGVYHSRVVLRSAKIHRALDLVLDQNLGDDHRDCEAHDFDNNEARSHG